MSELFCSFLVLYTLTGTPTNVTANRIGLTAVRVTWTAPSPPVDDYRVFYQADGGIMHSGGNTSNTELTLNQLTPGKTYSISVEAFGTTIQPQSAGNTTIS